MSICVGIGSVGCVPYICVVVMNGGDVDESGDVR